MSAQPGSPQKEIENLQGEGPIWMQIRLDGVTVLLIEDVLDGRLLIARLLSRAGASVFATASAHEAREFLSQARADVIVSDIAMPDEDGIAFIRWLRHAESQCGGHIPAIALTAFNDPKVRMQCLKAGFQAHVCKASSSALLLKTIQDLVPIDGSVLH